MKKSIIGIVVLVLVVFTLIRGVSMYNKLVEHEETVNEKWGIVQAEYQARNDKLPNLVEIVRGYAQVEKDILVQVTQARAEGMAGTAGLDKIQSSGPPKAESGEVNIDVAAFQSRQRGYGRAMSGMFGYAEKYPELKSNQGFNKLQDQLEGIENRISKARTDFNEEATVYNKVRRKFPANLYAATLGFDRIDLFEGSEEAQDAPEIDMGIE
ncbi:MAG: LemA family protein [Bacteroidota bacterium]